MNHLLEEKIDSIDTQLGGIHRELQTLNKNLILLAMVQSKGLDGFYLANAEDYISDMIRSVKET